MDSRRIGSPRAAAAAEFGYRDGAEVRVLAMRRVVSTPLAVLGAHFKGRASVWVWPAWPCGRLALF